MRFVPALALPLLIMPAACRDAGGPSGPVAFVDIADSAATLLIGDTIRFTATVRDSAGNRVSNLGVAWASADSVIATVSSSGLVTARAAGSIWVYAASGALADSVSVVVVDALLATRITAGTQSTCAIRPDDSVVCWGSNERGVLGVGLPSGSSVRPVPVAGGHTWRSVATGSAHSCGVTVAGVTYCWGYNDQVQLGDSSYRSHLIPYEVSAIRDLAAIDVGASRSCGIQSSGLLCWGAFSFSWLDTMDDLTVGEEHACYWSTAGRAACWGRAQEGQLGDGTTISSFFPVEVSGGLAFVSVAAGGRFTCGLTATGQAWCWGSNLAGQLGDGTTTQRDTPVAVSGGSTFTAIAAGTAHACATTQSGTVYCWGFNGEGQLGDGTTTDRLLPTRVASRRSFSVIAAGESHTCAITTEGRVFCWGDNLYGQVGDNSRLDRPTPVPVWPE